MDPTAGSRSSVCVGRCMYQPVRQEATATSAASQSPTQRDYWPTAGWRTAGPDQQRMDPAVLEDLNTAVPNFYPQVRSVLVIRHGYLVYERYWHGITASDGHDSRSVTKASSPRRMRSRGLR